MDDVISQGRDPDRRPRPSLPRRWRIGAGILLVGAAGLAVIVLAPRHAAIQPTPGTPPAPSPSGSYVVRVTVGSGVTVPTLPPPPNDAVIVVCAPSTGACSVRLNVRELKPEYEGGTTIVVRQTIGP